MILLYTTIALITLILINVPIAVAIGVTSMAGSRWSLPRSLARLWPMWPRPAPS